MIKRIIIEGADQQGKSTLCALLHEKLGWNIVHYGKPKEGFNYILDYLLPENTISDRNFLSEVVYSKVKNRLSKARPMLLSNLFTRDKTLLILLDREHDFIFDNTRHEEYSYRNIQKAISIYRDVYNNVNMDKVKLNPNSCLYDSQVQSIIDKINGSI
jgi:thymidylate kinase